MTIAALIVAAGKGSRFGSPIPKQYEMLLGRPLLAWTLDAFLKDGRIGLIQVVIRPEDRSRYDAAISACREARRDALLPPVAGGESRQDSVRAGLEGLSSRAPRHVLIHDAARPFVSPHIIGRVIAALDEAPGAIPALPVFDSLRRGDGGRLCGIVERDGLYRVQTPQGFRFDAIVDAHRRAPGNGATDDAALLQAAGLDVLIVPGDEDNFKVTEAADMARAERVVMSRLDDVRTGNGFDVHGFGPGDHVTLCGIRVPHSHGLVGHSDADAGLHALTDAILGAIGEGDIGAAFPPSDARWRGADSAIFLKHAADQVAARGGVIAHLDVTLICEAPKIGPHRAAMKARIAEILGLSLDRVSVKATTTERLGFTGRREGLAAQATATIRLPL